MNFIPLENLNTDSGETRIRAFLDAIPAGHAVTVADAMRETAITGRELWIKTAGDCVIERFIGRVKTACLVNPKTAKGLKKPA